MGKKNHISPKRGANILSRVRNISPENVMYYVNNVLPKHKMKLDEFERDVCPNWSNNIHQAPEQFGLCYCDDEYIYPRFTRNITIEEAEKYVYGWMRVFPVINPMSKLSATNDSSLVRSIALYMEKNPYEHDLRNIIQALIGSEPIVVNDILANALNNYSELFTVKTISKDEERFEIDLKQNYKQILNKKFMDRKEYFHLFDNIVNISESKISRHRIYYGAPGTGKSHSVNELIKGESVIRTTFHPDSDYSTFVGAYKPTTIEVPVRDVTGKVIYENGSKVTETRIIYEFVAQAFLQAYVNAWKFFANARDGEKPKKQFLVIEEINRGNCAQIFGDLFQLLDRNEVCFSRYYIHADKDITDYLKGEFMGLNLSDDLKDLIDAFYNKKGTKEEDWIHVADDVLSGKMLLLPSNFYIWATMNTSDQSLFPIDSAFKRRWDWEYVPIKDFRSEERKIEAKDRTTGEIVYYDWGKFMEEINKKIYATTNSADKQLGYFFCGADENKVISTETFVNKVIFYLWNDVFKDFGFGDDIFVDNEDKENPRLTFDKFFKDDKVNMGKLVSVFMENLKLPTVEPPKRVANVEDASVASSQKDRSKYYIEGEGPYNMGELVRKTVELYIDKQPGITVEKLIEDFKDVRVSLDKIFLDKSEYEEWLNSHSADKKKETRYQLVSKNDVEVYVTTQIRLEFMDDFINVAKNWGFTIEKVE